MSTSYIGREWGVDVYEKACAYFKNGQLREALGQFQLAIRQGSLSPENLILTYQKILAIHEQKEKYGEYVHTALEFAQAALRLDFPIQVTFFLNRSLEFLQKHPEIGRQGEAYKILALCWEKSGNLQEYLKTLEKSLSYFFARKNLCQGQALLDGLDPKYKKFFVVKWYHLKFAILQNHAAKVDEYLALLLEEFEFNKKMLRHEGIFFPTFYQELKEPLRENFSDEGNSTYLREWMIAGLFCELEGLGEDLAKMVPLHSQILNLILEGILLQPYHLPFYFYAAKYYAEIGMPHKMGQLTQFVLQHKSKREFLHSSRAHSMVLRMQKKGPPKVLWKDYFSQVSKIPKDSQRSAQELEAALEMFQKKKFAEMSSTIKTLEKNIGSLLRERKFNEAKVMMTDLEKLDPGNFLLGFYKLQGEQGERASAQGGEVLYNNLLHQISAFCREDGGKLGPSSLNENDDIRFITKSYLRFYQTEEVLSFQGIFNDLVVAFNSMGLHEVALLILDRVEENLCGGHKFNLEQYSLKGEGEKHLKEILGIQYLRTATLMFQKKDYEALGIVEAINRVMPLKREEALCFLYLEAEILRNLRKVQKSYRMYKKVASIDGGYRMTKERIKEIEQNK